MKKLLLIIVIITSGAIQASGQSYYKKKWRKNNGSSISISASSFRSIRGWKHGAEVAYNTSKNLQFGIFSYQGSVTAERPAEVYQGIQLSFPIMTFNKWSFGSSNRLGLYDKRFVSFLPMLKLDYMASKSITASSGVGLSDNYPVFDFKLTFHLKSLLK